MALGAPNDDDVARGAYREHIARDRAARGQGEKNLAARPGLARYGKIEGDERHVRDELAQHDADPITAGVRVRSSCGRSMPVWKKRLCHTLAIRTDRAAKRTNVLYCAFLNKANRCWLESCRGRVPTSAMWLREGPAPIDGPPRVMRAATRHQTTSTESLARRANRGSVTVTGCVPALWHGTSEQDAKRPVGDQDVDQGWDGQPTKKREERCLHVPVYRDEQVLRVADRAHDAADGDGKCQWRLNSW